MEVADEIRKAVPEDLSRIGSALGRAFFDDPLFVWAIQDDGRRQRFLLEFFTLYAKAFLRHDETYTTEEKSSRPRCGRLPERSRLAARTPRSWAGWSKSCPDPTRHASSTLTKLFDDHHPHGSYWYLQFMGVTPGWQGQGIGSALVAPMLERCDREGVRAYLDATSERNKGLV